MREAPFFAVAKEASNCFKVCVHMHRPSGIPSGPEHVGEVPLKVGRCWEVRVQQFKMLGP